MTDLFSAPPRVAEITQRARAMLTVRSTESDATVTIYLDAAYGARSGRRQARWWLEGSDPKGTFRRQSTILRSRARQWRGELLEAVHDGEAIISYQDEALTQFTKTGEVA